MTIRIAACPRSLSRRLARCAVLALAAFAAFGARAQSAPPPDTLEQRLKACAICHGDLGEGLQRNEYYPRLAGKPAQYLYNQLVNFRDRRRVFAIMNYLVAHLSDAYLLEIAEYYAKLDTPYPGPSARAPAETIARGARLALEGDAARRIPACVECHGKTLTGVEPAIPGLVGLYGPYIAAQMGAWKNDKRHAMQPDCMREVAQLLTPTDIEALTAWLVAQPVPANRRPAPAGSVKPPLECGGITPRR